VTPGSVRVTGEFLFDGPFVPWYLSVGPMHLKEPLGITEATRKSCYLDYQ